MIIDEMYSTRLMNMNESIRVLCVFSSLERGGAESMCMNLYRHIDRTRVQYDFIKYAHPKDTFIDKILEQNDI